MISVGWSKSKYILKDDGIFVENLQRRCYDAPYWKLKDITNVKDGKVIICLVDTWRPTVTIIEQPIFLLFCYIIIIIIIITKIIWTGIAKCN
jgi:hypothetical protein